MENFQNKATLSFNGRITNSNVTTGEIIDIVSATKTAVVGTYSANGNVTFIISIVNSETTPLTNVMITDDLGEDIYCGHKHNPLSYVDGSCKYYIDGELQKNPPKVIQKDNSIIIQNLLVPQNGNTIIAYEAVANKFAPVSVGSTITNKANIFYNEFRDKIQVRETIKVRENANLTISKLLSPESITEDSVITYTFIIQNTGNINTAKDSVIITDTFNPKFDNIYVTLNDKPLTLDKDYTYSSKTGVFSTEKTKIVVPKATYSRNSDGVVITDPGVVVIKITGKLTGKC